MLNLYIYNIHKSDKTDTKHEDVYSEQDKNKIG
jgi:hypothetical protein